MKKILLAVSALMIALCSAAQTTEVLTHTRIERNPRSAAFAGAGSASLSSVAYASFSNAALVPFYEGIGDFAAGYQYWAPSLGAANGANLAGSFKFGNVGVSLGGVYQMEQTDVDGFRPNETQVNLGFGFKILRWMGLGVNARYVGQALMKGTNLNAVAFDVNAMFAPVKGLSLMAGLENIGTKVASSSGTKYPQPASLRFAAAYKVLFGKHGLEVMLDEDYFLYSNNYSVSGGLEYNFNQIVFVRGGYRYASKGCAYPTHASVGLGAQFKGFHLDVTYITASEVLGNSIVAGLGYRF